MRRGLSLRVSCIVDLNSVIVTLSVFEKGRNIYNVKILRYLQLFKNGKVSYDLEPIKL